MLVWFCITLATFHARITTLHLYLLKLYLKHYWFHFFRDTMYRVPESNAVLCDDRRKEDTAFCQQFLDGFYVGIVYEGIKEGVPSRCQTSRSRWRDMITIHSGTVC